MLNQQYTEFEFNVQLQDPFVLYHARRLALAYQRGDTDRALAIRQEFIVLCGDDPATMAAFGKRCAEFAAG